MARSGTNGSRLNWLIARQDVDYINQITHRTDPYTVRTAPAKLGNSSVTLVAEIFNPDDGATFARGRTVLVAADRQGKPIELPDEVRTDLSERLIA